MMFHQFLRNYFSFFLFTCKNHDNSKTDIDGIESIDPKCYDNLSSHFAKKKIHKADVYFTSRVLSTFLVQMTWITKGRFWIMCGHEFVRSTHAHFKRNGYCSCQLLDSDFQTCHSCDKRAIRL